MQTVVYENETIKISEWKDDGKSQSANLIILDNGVVLSGNFIISQFGLEIEGLPTSTSIHGVGTITYTNGDIYTGDIGNGVPDGQGTYTYPNGNKYVGGFKGGRYHGQGTETFTDGRKYVGYVGEFEDGYRHGQGTLTFADGRVKEGIWEGWLLLPIVDD